MKNLIIGLFIGEISAVRLGDYIDGKPDRNED